MAKPPKSKINYMFSDDLIFIQKAIILHPNENKFLTILRSPNSHVRPRTWDLVGGSVSYGENNETALRREIKEEINLEVSVIEPIKILTLYEKTEEIYHLIIGYKTQAVGGLNIKLSNEHSAYRWVNQKEFLKLQSATFLQDMVKKL